MTEKNFNSIFSNNLRYYLDKNEMTQLELSKLLNVGTTSVYNWCNGVKTPRMDKVDKMCEIFGCSRSDLITESLLSSRLDEPTCDYYLQLNDNESVLIEILRECGDDFTQRVLAYAKFLKDMEHK